MKLLMVDNYDSFTWNLVHLFEELGAEVDVFRNDAITVEEAEALAPDRLVISPGPGRPEDAGVSVELIRALGTHTPTLGVCLGHQAIVEAFGGRVGRAQALLHGKSSVVRHDGEGVYAGLPEEIEAGRYHSLAALAVPDDLVVTARTEDGEVMGVQAPRASGSRACSSTPRASSHRVGRRSRPTSSAEGYRFAMAKTLFDRIWESHVVHETPGEPALLYVDLHLIHEVTSPQAFDGLRLAGRTRAPPGPLDRDDGPQRPDAPGADHRPARACPARGAARELRGVRHPALRDGQRARGHRPRDRPGARPLAAGPDDRLRRQPHVDARRLRRARLRHRDDRGRARARDAVPSRGCVRRRCGSSTRASCRSG